MIVKIREKCEHGTLYLELEERKEKRDMMLTDRKGFFDRKIWDSKVHTEDTSAKEKIFGYLIGPVGALLLNTILGGYINLYYTDVLKLTAIGGGAFLAIFPLISKILDAATNVLMGYIIDHTRTKQGKARPYILLAAVLLPVSGILMYIIPAASQTVQLIWVVLTYNFFYAVAVTIYNMSHNMMIPLSTRNSEQRATLSTFASIANIVFAGTLAAVLVPMLVLPAIGVNRQGWITMACVVSVFVLPLSLLEYYYTKERITEEQKEKQEDTEVISYRQQFLTCLKDPYMMMVLGIWLVYQLVTILRNTSLLYYCNYILGSYNDGITPTLLQVLGGVPMGLGMFVIVPLTRKYQKRTIFLIGNVMLIVGNLICLTAPANMTVVIIGQVIKNIGCIPGSYIFMAMFADCLDHFEWKHHFRCDGFAMSVYSIILTVASGICTSVFNLILARTGYVAPELVDGVTVAAEQSELTKSGILWSYYGVEIIGTVLIILLFYFLKVEKGLKEKQEELKPTGKSI